MEISKTSDSFNWNQGFSGMMDTDGSIRISIIDREKKREKRNPSHSNLKPLPIPFGFEISLTLSQSNSKEFFSFLETYLGSLKTWKRQRLRNFSLNEETRWSIFLTSIEGQKISKGFDKTPLLNPARRNDFLVAKLLINLLEKKKNSTKKGLATCIYLAYQTYNQQNVESTINKKTDISKLFNKLALTKTELEEALYEGEMFYFPIKQEIESLKLQLPAMTLAIDYIVGAHWGDGSLTFFLPWQSQFITRPIWTLSDASEPYLEAFRNTLSAGKVKKQKGSFQYQLDGITNAQNIVVPLFENKPLPFYKENQYKRFKKAVELLINKDHLTMIGGRQLLDLVYDISENSKRKLSKETLIEILDNHLAKGN